MEFSLDDSSQKAADLLVIPYWKDKKGVKAAASAKKWNSYTELPLASQDFKGKVGEFLLLYVKGEKQKRIALLGLGEKDQITTEILRRAYGAVAKLCNQREFKEIALLFPHIPGVTEEAAARGVIEGLLLANYNFTKHKHDALKDAPVSLIEKICFLGAKKNVLTIAKKALILAESVYFVRDLVNTNADDITPKQLIHVAKQLAKNLPRVTLQVFDKKRIKKEKMGLLLAVNRGSGEDPAMILMEYKGSPKAKEHVILIGKGVTYDTGGLNLKTGTGMDTMKSDMAGAAVALGTLKAAAELALPIHLTILIPTTENSISAQSYKPGDVYSGLTGKTVEIVSTDAEGRLILADALAYAVKHLKPTQLIDVATLTGGIEVALGSEVTGMMSNNDALAALFMRAGSETFERVWRMPLIEEYKDNLRSDVADIKNAGTRSASPINGALFLRYFVDDIPWVHFDMGGTAFATDAKRYTPKHATGIGVRLLIEFLELSLG